MSNAKPMTPSRRVVVYASQRMDYETLPQKRQDRRMRSRFFLRLDGRLTPSGASGDRVRKPLPGRPLWTPTGSIATHVAYHCDPATCPQHDRPRMHRKLREVAA